MKLMTWCRNHKKLTACLMAVMMLAIGMVGVSADEGAGGTGNDLNGFITSIKGALGDFTTGNLATIIVAALGLTVGLAIAWFAYRFIKGKVSGAMKKGKL